MTAEEILVALAIKFKGNWEDIYCATQNKEYDDLDNYLAEAISNQYRYITILSPEYPELLRKQYMPPFVLFYYGDISLLTNVAKNVAVVGSRECSDYGKEMTEKIVKEICHEYTIVSGMAIGIDTVAHHAAIEGGGKTIAILGGGIDYIYPPSNRKLYQELKKNHLIVSEYPGNTITQPDNFPRRNRIIAMISRGTIVTEAYARSGTLTTVMFTLQCNRLLLCVPYLATSDSECNRLIANGAYLIQSGKEAISILENDIHI